MKSFIYKEKADIFDNKVALLLREKNSDHLDEIFEAGSSLVYSILRYYGDLYFDKNFSRDVVLECLHALLLEEKNISPTRVLRNIAHTRIKHLLEESETALLPTFDTSSYSVDIQSRLIFEETLQSVLFLLPLHIQSAILYLIFYPNKDSIFRSLYSDLDFFLILRSIEQIRKCQFGVVTEDQEYFNFDLPASQTGCLLLVSSLYKLSPAVLVLLMQTKNLETVLQFCKLFGGQTLKIPRISELSSAVVKAATLAKNVEEGIRIGDQESLAYLATELKEIKKVDYTKLSLNPLLSSFIHQSLSVTLKNYEAYQNRLISSVDTTDSEDISRIYTLINKELISQAYLLLQLTTSIEEYPDIRKILNILRNEKINKL